MQGAVKNYDKLTSEEKADVSATKFELSEQIVLGLLEQRLANQLENAQSKEVSPDI